MNGAPTNPYALYVCCDGAMDYDARNTGGVGFEIVFPESVALESIRVSIGKYVGGNIERLELEAISQGMNKVLKLFKDNRDQFSTIRTIVFTTDRLGLNDDAKTNPYRIQEWRKNKWHNHEGKAIKNSDLLDKIDKTRKRITQETYCSVEIQYKRRKFNKTPDKLAKEGKTQAIVRGTIAVKGAKIGRRKYDEGEVDYQSLEEKREYVVHVFKKEPVREQWEICVEMCEGELMGKKLKIYTDPDMERKLRRRHEYKIRIKDVFTHHVTIYRTINERKTV